MKDLNNYTTLAVYNHLLLDAVAFKIIRREDWDQRAN